MVRKSDGPALEPDVVAEELRSAILRTSRRLRRETGRDDITPGQHAVLTALMTGPLTPTQLADQEQVRPPWMTRTVGTLEQLGLVARADNPADGRQVLVSLTEAGTELLDKTRQARTEWLSALVSDVDDDERAVLARAARILLRLTAP